MKKIFILLTSLLLESNQSNLNNLSNNNFQAILKLNTGAHTALIEQIITTAEGDIISASKDKTVRVWDIKNKKEKRKILGQIGNGNEGMVYAIAITPNQKYLAVGGFLAEGHGINDDLVGAIRIFDYKSGKLLKILKSHTDVINDLSFSEDGKYLISTSTDTTAKVWSVDNWNLKDTIKVHENIVNRARIIKKDKNYYSITIGDDNKLVLYNIQTQKVVKSHKLPYKLEFLATSKERIAVCGFNEEIQIYNHNLKPIKTIKSETNPSGLSYSPDGKYLISGTSNYPYHTNIYSVNQSYKKIKTFKKHQNLVQSVAFVNNQTAVSGGGNNNEIYIWNIKDDKTLKIEGVGKTIWSVGIKDNKIAWGNILDIGEKNNLGHLQKYIDLKTFEIKDYNKSTPFKKIKTKYNNLYLIHREGGEYGYPDGILDIKEGNKTVASITLDLINGLGHKSYGFYKNYIISGGANGEIKIYNLKGRKLISLIGHEGEVVSLAIDGDKLISGSSDQTIKVWNLSKIDFNKKPKINNTYLLEMLKALKEHNITKEDALKTIESNNNLYNRFHIFPKIKPQLSIFISKHNDWIIWTKEGFYNASKGADKYLEYHINQGIEKEALFYNVEKFKEYFFRPDLIQKAINGEDLSKYSKEIDIKSLLKINKKEHK